MAFRDLVVFIPGICGSTLLKDGEPVWAPSYRAISDALLKGSLNSLTVTSESPAEDLVDGIEVGQVMPTAHMIPGLWKIDGYGPFVDRLRDDLELEFDRNFFLFPYDWRRDNRVSARVLARKAHAWLKQWRETSGASDARLVIVAHSMGGLVARYFIECLEGWRSTRRLITVGTPHRGSLNALGFLVNGYAKGIGPFSVDATKPLRSFASVHQLLPTFGCVAAADGYVNVGEAGLPNLDAARVADAAAFHLEIRNSQTDNANQPGYPADYLSPVLSSRQLTFQSARRDGERVALLREHSGENRGGDGTVPTVSAIPIGMDVARGVFLSGLHAELTNTESLGDYAVGALASASIDLDKFRSAEARPKITMSLDDAYVAGEPCEIAAFVDGVKEQSLKAEAVEATSGETVRTTLFPSERRFLGRLVLPDGLWRINVSGLSAESVSDVILVAAAGNN